MGVIIGKFTYTPTPPPTSVPTVTTTTLTDIKSLSALGGGNITYDGGAPVTARGICWSTSPNPTTANSTTSDGTGTGAFSSIMRILDPDVTYYVRAYATNSQGTGYGTQQTITTRSFRIMKVNKFCSGSIPNLLNSVEVDNMISTIVTHDFNWIQLYDLGNVFGSGTRQTALANFISKSRAAGVERVGAIRGLNQNNWSQVLNWNTSRQWYEQFDDFNVESEFWWWYDKLATGNHPDSTDWGTWSASVASLKTTLDNPTYNRGSAYLTAGGNPWIISAYINNYNAPPGWWSTNNLNDQATGSILAELVDVWEATNYNQNKPNTSWLGVGGARPQLQYLASGAFALGVTRSFVPIYSLEMISWGGEDNLSGVYFSASVGTGLVGGETIWDNEYNTIVLPAIPHKENIKLIGHNYFAYTYVTRSVGI